MLNLTRLHLGIAHESQFQGLGITQAELQIARVHSYDRIFHDCRALPPGEKAGTGYMQKTAWIIARKRLASGYGIDPWHCKA